MKLLCVCLSVVVLALCGQSVADKLPAAGTLARQVEDDTLSSGSGPYAPSGWQPNGPQLQLPHREYGAPGFGENDNNNNGVEVSKENIVFAGQLVGTEVQTTVVPPAATTTTTTVSSRYLPPSGADGQVCMHLARLSGCNWFFFLWWLNLN